MAEPSVNEELAEEAARFIDSEEWKEGFDHEAHERGASYARKRKVQEIKVEWPDPECLILQASVKGSERKPHQAEVTIWREGHNWHYEAECNCSYAHFCEHGAAILLSLPKAKMLTTFLLNKGGGARIQKAEQLLQEREPAKDIAHLRVTPRFRLRIESKVPTSKVLRHYFGKFASEQKTSWVLAIPEAIYGEYTLPIIKGDHERIFKDKTGNDILIERNREEEEAATRQLMRLGLINLGRDAMWIGRIRTEPQEQRNEVEQGWFPDPVRFEEKKFWPLFRAEMQDYLKEDGWEVSIQSNVGFHVHKSPPEQWKAKMNDLSGGWFDLSVGFVVAGKHYDLLPILANMLEEGYLEETLDRPNTGSYLAPLANGDALQLPLGRVRGILRNLASILSPHRHKARLHALDAAAVSESGILPLSLPKELKNLSSNLKDFQGLAPVAPPKGLLAKLRNYQIEGFRWLQFLARHELHGILADDMGLGKTLQTLAHILTEKERMGEKKLPILVVAPTSVVSNWKAEAAKFTPSLQVLVLQGAERKKFFSAIKHADIVLTSYALLHRDIEKLQKEPFHLAVFDEAQHIKNSSSKVSQAACELQVRHRICLTGTPVENHLGELWSQFRFLMPGFLGSQEDFRRRFQRPIENDNNEEKSLILRKRIAPLILRRTKDKVAKELPPKTELVHKIELSTAQKDLYETVRATMDKRVRDAISMQGIAKSHIVFLEALLKLRQICCHPQLLKIPAAEKARSGKLDFLVNLLNTLTAEGRRTLIFSQFTSMLALIEDHLKRQKIDYLKLTGATKDRGILVEKFQEQNVPVFLISLKAGGTGLNLTAADTVIHYDPWWNPAVEAQATDRAYRIGQTQPVFVHKLICEGTVEERIQALQSKKASIAEDVLSTSERASKPDAEMMRALLAPLESQ